ncbi:MAG TPA: HAMP domain-containing sensor histidine kinase [Candidatus Limnocylindria bacterium]|nr:HAMP domain-containing sensor histidine kinase [Candidatus Limnocylindria bacterium]
MRRRAPRALAVIGLVLAAPAIALIDLTTGLEFSFSIFYVIPPVAAAWYFGRELGIGVSVVTGLSWAYAESVARVASLPAATWNRGTRVLVLIAFAYLIDLVHRHQNELRRLLTQRDEFLSMVAHELRAPVAAIEIVAAGLAQDADLHADKARSLDRLRDQAHGLAGLAESLLSVGQLEAGVGRLDMRDIDLRSILVALGDGEHRLTITVPDEPVYVNADADALRRAIVNVVGNALKFSSPDRRVDIVLQAAPSMATVRVTDHGIGLEPAEVGRLFLKYGRMRTEGTAHIPGVGLGLYFTRLVLAAHGGSIDATSPGRGSGSTFELHVPRSNGPARAGAPQRARV